MLKLFFIIFYMSNQISGPDTDHIAALLLFLLIKLSIKIKRIFSETVAKKLSYETGNDIFETGSSQLFPKF